MGMIINEAPVSLGNNGERTGAARATIYRKPLRGKTGCSRCRERRKKCDEAKPTCGDCKRLGYYCKYTKQKEKRSITTQTSVVDDDILKNLIIETYLHHRNEMIIYPRMEETIKGWVEESDRSGNDSEKRERRSSVSSSSSCASDSTATADSNRSSPVKTDTAENFSLSLISNDIGVTANADRTEGEVFETTLPIWRNIAVGFPGTQPKQDDEDQHIVLSIVLFGWEQTAKTHQLSDLWKTFGELYEPLAFAHRPVVERLAVLDINWRMAKIEASQKFSSGVYEGVLPGFYDTRPLNRYLPNPRAPTIKFFPWPGVREHMALRPLRYRKDKFIRNLYSEFRFLFPSIQDAYQIDAKTGRYAFSAAYLEMRDNLSAWTMTSDFFKLFPELKDDIATFNPEPTGMQLSVVSPHLKETTWQVVQATRRRFEPAGEEEEAEQPEEQQQLELWPSWDEQNEMQLDFSEFLVDFEEG